MRTPRFWIVASLLLTVANGLPAAELLPADKPVEQVIDHYIDATLKQDNIAPAAQADDATLIRRLTLDLVGRIPTATETAEYVGSKDAQKRTKLVERLMASPAFARYQATQFDTMLNSTADNRRGSLREYFQTALKDNKSWDKIFRDLMLPPVEADPKKRGGTGPAEFLKARMTDADRLTNDVSVVFFGVNVSCAQCHDHPLVEDWKQDHFFGMKSFLARTFDAGGFLAERGAGLVKFKPTKGPERDAKLMFLTGATVPTDTLREPTKDEQKQEKEAADKAKNAKQAPPAPKFSARERLVEVALKPSEASFFSKSIVNRMWHRFFGYGLVMPLDQMHSENPPSHPQLMDWLARDTRDHGYDLRRLIRGLVMSQTYSRSSRYDSQDHPPATYFAVARLKPLTPVQLATSLKVAVTDPAEFEKAKSPDEFDKKIEQIESSARGLAAQIVEPTDDFQIGVGEALLFSNGDRVMKEYLTDGGGMLLGRVKAMKESKEIVELMVRTVFNRPPTGEEVAALSAYLGRREDRTPDACRQVLWALLTSPEFRFNY